MSLVLDAGALIAILKNEPGGDVAAERIDAANDAGELVCVHVLNVCEVFYGVSREHDVLTARSALRDLFDTGLQTRADTDSAFWEDAAQLKADWKRVSLADCFGVALARRLNTTFLTTDRHELEALQNAGVANIESIR